MPLEKRYARKIRARLMGLRESFKSDVLADLPRMREEYRQSLPRFDDAINYIARLVNGLKIVTGRYWSYQELEDLAHSQMEDVNVLVKKSIDHQWKRVLGVDPMQNDRGIQEFLLARAKENAQLISNIPQKQVAQIESGLLNAVSSGLRVEEISKFIDDKFEDMASNASTIARTETGKIVSSLTEYRQRSLGVDQYRWATVGDDRVRPSHRALDGQIFSWDDPPVVDGEAVNPGQAINCRCLALPVIE